MNAEREKKIEFASDLLRMYGVVPFTRRQEINAFEMAYGEAHTLPSFPSELAPRNNTEILIPKKNALVIACGGSNNYVNVYQSTHDNTCIPGEQFESPVLSFQQAFERVKFSSRDEFYDTVVRLLQPALVDIFSRVTIDALGFVYSNRGNAQQYGSSVDVWPDENMTKDFSAPGISKSTAGIGLITALRRAEYPIHKDIPRIVGNDGSLLALGHPGTQISIIDGTGFNIALAESTVQVKEAGDYLQHFPLSKIEEELNAYGPMRGKYKAETIAGGKNMQHQMNRIISLFERNGLLYPSRIKGPLSGPQISQILAHDTPVQGFDEYLHQFTPEDSTTWSILRLAAQTIRDRAASVIKTVAGGIIAAHPESFQTDTITCTLEGSTILYTPGLMDRVVSYLETTFPQKRFHFVSSSSVEGAGFAALRAYSHHHS